MKQPLKSLPNNKYASLLVHMNRFVELTAEEQEHILNAFTYQLVKKKEYILTEGQICHSTQFVMKGCFRSYLITEKGTEQIIQFGIENWWITDYDSFDNQQPSRLFIQAIEDTEIIVIDLQTLEELYVKVPKVERYFRIILQKNFIAAQRRILTINTVSGEQRYLNFRDLFPDFVQRVPQYMLASYLGLTPEFLSMIRAKKDF
jgi:CRP-like cAMP-binding protein